MSRIQANLVHLRQMLAVHLVDIASATDIPDFDHFIRSYRDGKRTIKGGLNRIDIALMALKVGDILPLLSIPDLHIVLH